MRRLVETWVKAEKEYHGLSQAQAIKRLGETVDANITHSRLSEWRRGRYCPNPVVLSEMLYRALPWILKQAGISATPKQLDLADRLLWVIETKEDGLQHRDFL